MPLETTANEIYEKFKRLIMKDKKVELFDNELTRAFYEDFPDLSVQILAKNIKLETPKDVHSEQKQNAVGTQKVRNGRKRAKAVGNRQT